MKKATTKTAAKATAKKTPAKKTAEKKTTTKKTTVKPATVKKAVAEKPTSVQSAKMEKLNKLERALAENQISRSEYEMWKNVYAKEVPFNLNIIEEEDYRPRKTRRRSYYN
ncbi:MAG: hypothetical protein A2W93_12045 [Bacteroidetes bacterium GWF2_43_63]|nr:MAG: hypothetical protein A2W94_11595 [Bacteroidetes bacterium GWE2_42_42]OFY56356.1 MAG: hypothetical protein A2W93_12045 [Bacteroidetes bacterium GWF2_43_63]